MKRAFVMFSLSTVLLAGVIPAQAQSSSGSRMAISYVVGCLAEEEGKWVLTSATDPVAVAGLPGSKTDNDPAADTPLGRNRFTLIGTVGEFSPEKHKGRKVRVKGLVIKAAPQSRVNITSLKMLSPDCK